VSNQLNRLLSTGPWSTSKKKICSRLGECSLWISDQIENLFNEMDVHCLVFSLISSQCLIDHVLKIFFRQNSQARSLEHDRSSIESLWERIQDNGHPSHWRDSRSYRLYWKNFVITWS
jgi:hypothetical protein